MTRAARPPSSAAGTLAGDPPATRQPAAGGSSGAELASQLAYLTRVLKTPAIAGLWQQLGDTARAEGWSHEEYLATVLARQVADREANGTALRTAGAHFPSIKTLEDFNADHQPALRRDILAHLAMTTFIPAAGNVVLLGPPGVGKTGGADLPVGGVPGAGDDLVGGVDGEVGGGLVVGGQPGQGCGSGCGGGGPEGDGVSTPSPPLAGPRWPSTSPCGTAWSPRR